MQIQKNHFSLLSLITLAFLASPFVQAAYADEDSDVSYEEIVKDLSKEQRNATNSSRTSASNYSRDSLDDVMIHGGVGITQMFGTVDHAAGTTHLSQRGIQASLGIDLFSEHLLAEGTARNFSPQDYRGTSISLKEFDLKVIYHNTFAPKIGFKLGAGLAARYLHIASNMGTSDYTTPSSVITGGFEFLPARSLTVGADISQRSALIGETADRNSYDMTVRVDANF